LAESIPFVPPITSGLVIKVYDGDTFTLVSKLPYLDSPVYRFSVRLLGIDCAELKSKDETEKSCAIAARDELTRMVLNKYVTLHNVQTEKYGRILANVYVDDLNVNKHMLEKRLAVEYNGKTKRSPENWLQIVNGLKS
jgi:endonuclease YncB( thermonuclease family)